jgi:uncharacterized protein (DUF58 family)
VSAARVSKTRRGGTARTPDKPGPGPVPDALLRTLRPVVRRRVEGLAAGEHASTLLGEGTELAQIRPYEPGDDVRQIDWNATARTGEPHVRKLVAEKALTAWVALDVSPSMAFGTADRRKADVAEGVVIVLASLATRGGGRVGLIAFGGRRPLTIPPRAGRAGALALIEAARRDPEDGEVGQTSVGNALSGLARLARRRGPVAVVSDFRGPMDWRRPLAGLAGRHEVFAVEVRDPREDALPDVGDLLLEDPETGRQLRADTGSRRLRERFAAAAAAERREVAAEIARSGADHVVLSTRGDWLKELALHLGRRTPRRGGAR